MVCEYGKEEENKFPSTFFSSLSVSLSFNPVRPPTFSSPFPIYYNIFLSSLDRRLSCVPLAEKKRWKFFPSVSFSQIRWKDAFPASSSYQQHKLGADGRRRCEKTFWEIFDSSLLPCHRRMERALVNLWKEMGKKRRRKDFFVLEKSGEFLIWPSVFDWFSRRELILYVRTYMRMQYVMWKVWLRLPVIWAWIFNPMYISITCFTFLNLG